MFFRHDWKYSREKIEYEVITSLPTGITVNVQQNPSYPKLMIDTNIRICNRCYKKQKVSKQGTAWTDYKLTEQQLRDKKLKDLGI